MLLRNLTAKNFRALATMTIDLEESTVAKHIARLVEVLHLDDSEFTS